MKHFWVFLVLCLASLLLIQSSGFASAIYNGDQDAKAQGMSSIFIAQADNPSAIFYNPAGITQLDSTQVSVGCEFVNFQADFKNLAGLKEDLLDRWDPVPNIYITSDFGTKKFRAGLGINAPFGLSTKWSKTGLLRYDATFSKMELISINPTIAYEILPELSLAAGVDYYYVKEYDLNAMYDYGNLVGLPGAFDGRVQYEGDGSGWGFNLGAMFKPSPRHSFGLTFRNAVSADTDGKYKATSIPSFMGWGSELSYDASSEFKFPYIIGLGYAFRPIEKLKIEVDVSYLGWSVHDKLVIKNKDLGGSLMDKTVDWRDSWTTGIGAEYLATDRWALRAGYIYLESAIPNKTFSPSVPNLDRHVLSLGTGYKWEKFEVNVAYSAGISSNRKIEQNNLSTTALGTYGTFINEVGVSVAYKF